MLVHHPARCSSVVAFALLILALLGWPAPTVAEREPSPALRIAAFGTGIRLEWRGLVALAPSGTPELAGWTTLARGGTRIPARVLALRAGDHTNVTPRIERLESVPWQGAPLDLLSDTPLMVLREGRMRGARIVVIAIMPIFQQGGAARMATSLAATIPGATLLDDDAAALLATNRPFLASAPGPTNPAAAGASFTVRVSRAGIQRISGAALAMAGADLNNLDPSQLHLRRRGVEIALEERGTGDGRLDPADELRFYAPAPGDRWNASETYWLTIEATPGRRMGERDAREGAAPLRLTAIERGIWRDNRIYDSRLPGPDGDHWYATDLRTGPAQPPAMFSVPLTATLPLTTGTTTLAASGSAYTTGQHTLAIQFGGASITSRWSGSDGWTRTFTWTTRAERATLTLVPEAAPDGIELDSVAYERPVTLNFGGRGAHFAGVAGRWRYQLEATPSDRALYDISDPRSPVALTIPGGLSPRFEDGPTPREYVLSGPETLHVPAVAAHAPIDLAAPLDAGLLYIAPAAFHQTLAPLIARRRAQGQIARVVDVQAIYDAWSFGQIAPDAIRDFLRYAAATWRRPPTAVVLVGDGTSDPLNYTGRGNRTFVPPYMAMVDPWLGETACEPCYAQLDGADPLSDLLPDLLLGRLPVKSAAELAALVDKIIGYETAPIEPNWQARVVFIADNYRDADGNPDAAGDFAAFADRQIWLQPPGVEIERVYYDPSPTHTQAPWREPDAARARARTLAALNGGAAIVTYAGHSNHWQWAVTDPAATPPYLLELYDADSLANRGRLPILLEMTCLTSGFQHPAYSGTTIDERLLLHPGGGAVAIWGPTGRGVLHGHIELARGFYEALWDSRSRPASARLGQLAAAGYLELFTQGGCCQDALRTFALLGDPLTRVRAMRANRTYLPGVER